ncbi:uncharacterized protein LOC111709045 isoform X1 [Eurytemora carolleeae]|uniref:uncharacterized protein LOC111709045 isoform X1 n=2 Tax=Eurytemora carolleeae TaxID=1294199 RepID=UPI000C7773DD|nr:uncharacterized protein LOC111709045 isoform X1 [Eurytemora carolleeae]|eukprot:XP_023338394.1 uncharacterized protein LOC111709045 isoform X1 [Eurytemora affinis]
MKDDVVGRMRDEMEALLSEESSGEEEEEDEDERDDYQNGKIEGKDGKKESVKILYYHETRQIEDKMTENEAGDGTPVDEGGWNEYGWKRKIPASKFGQIVQAQGKRVKDKQFTKEILTYNGGEGDTEATLYGRVHEKDARQRFN